MKIICAGLPRTGTKTVAAALRYLDFNVFDAKEQLDVRPFGLRKKRAFFIKLMQVDDLSIILGHDKFQVTLQAKMAIPDSQRYP